MNNLNEVTVRTRQTKAKQSIGMLVGIGVRVNSELWRGGNRQNLYNLHLSVQQAFLAPEVEYAVELRATVRFRDWPLGAPLPGLCDGQQQG